MNPVGIKPAIKQIPMADRPGKLGGKAIYIVDICLKDDIKLE